MSPLSEEKISSILIGCDCSTEAIFRLYGQLKEQSPKISLASFCKRAGLSSTGSFSDVLQGRRFLSERYLAGVSSALGLDALQTEFLSLLLRRDRNSKKWADHLEPRIEGVKRALALTRNRLLKQVDTAVDFHLKVLSAFALVGGRAQPEQVARLFPVSSRVEVKLALQKLKANGLLRIYNNGEMEPDGSRLLFGQSEDGYSHIAFLKESVEDALGRIETDYDKRKESVFVSSIISVSKDTLAEKIAELKSEIVQSQSKLEGNKGECDALMRFNIQAYLLDVKRKSS